MQGTKPNVNQVCSLVINMVESLHYEIYDKDPTKMWQDAKLKSKRNLLSLHLPTMNKQEVEINNDNVTKKIPLKKFPLIKFKSIMSWGRDPKLRKINPIKT